MRSFGRMADEMRPLTLEPGISRHAEGSCLVQIGYTKVLCTASVDSHVPPFLRNTGKGWVTAEYSMLPRSTESRSAREAARGKQTGRTVEIQRLIGRSLRAVTDLQALGERQIIVDCDVLEADGGTRTASITGGYVALHLAMQKLKDMGLIKKVPLSDMVAAISCGVCEDTPLLDLDYSEDSNAIVDANFVMSGNGDMIEVQATGEGRPFSDSEFTALIDLAKKGVGELVRAQQKAVSPA